MTAGKRRAAEAIYPWWITEGQRTADAETGGGAAADGAAVEDGTEVLELTGWASSVELTASELVNLQPPPPPPTLATLAAPTGGIKMELKRPLPSGVLLPVGVGLANVNLQRGRGKRHKVATVKAGSIGSA